MSVTKVPATVIPALFFDLKPFWAWTALNNLLIAVVNQARIASFIGNKCVEILIL